MNSLIQNMITDKVVVLSGVFDPVHNGHISIAQHVYDLGAKQVVFLPEKMPQHKHGATQYRHRIAMLQLAVEKYSYFAVFESPFEKHTIAQTLPWIRKQYSENQQIVLLFGADVATHIEHWPQINKLQKFGVDTIVFAQRSKKRVSIPHIENVQIATFNHSAYTISSTQIRLDLNGHATDMPESVLNYIREKNLY